MLEELQSASATVNGSATGYRRERIVLATEPELEVPGDPEAFARKHPDTVVHRLFLWDERPGLLAHAVANAAEVATAGTLDALRYQIEEKYRSHPDGVVREGCLHALHAMALRVPELYLQWAIHELACAAAGDPSETVRDVARELLDDLVESPPPVTTDRKWALSC